MRGLHLQMEKGLVVNSRLQMVASAPPADETAGVLENLRLLVSELEKAGEDKRLPNERLLAERLGLDGVHLSDAARSVRHARKVLGPDAIVGSFCAGSRHDGMSAGEAGADYIAFGPVQATALNDGEIAEAEMFQWWSEVIEVPCVAEGQLDAAMIAKLAPMTDFFGIGEEIWGSDDPAAALKTLWSAIG